MPLRIALASDWYAPRRGGIESQLQQLTGRLAARGHQVDVLTTTPGPAIVDGSPVIRLDGPRLPFAGVSIAPTLVAQLRERLAARYDVVHAHVSVVSPLGYAAAAAARSLGLPTVVTFHSVLRAKQALLAAADWLLGIGRASVVWSAVSERVADEARRALGADVIELPNGFEPAEWPPLDRALAADGRVTIVTASRLHRKKRVAELFGSFQGAVARTGSAARLLVCGDGPEWSRLERMVNEAALPTGATVELRGWCDAAQLRTAFAESDVFAIASHREAFGIATLEARACGLRVLAMRDAGSAEFLRDDPGAELCEDDEGMAVAMAAVMRSAARSRLRPGDRLRRYEWDAVVRAHEQAYARATVLAAGAGAR